MRCCALLSLAPATIFMARVIFCVDLTLEIRLRMDLRLGTAAYFSFAFEALLPFFDFALGAGAASSSSPASSAASSAAAALAFEAPLASTTNRFLNASIAFVMRDL